MSWRSVIITRPSKLSLKNNQMQILQEEVWSVPVEDISALVIESSQVVVTEGLLSKLCENNTVVYICDHKHIPNGYVLPYYQHSRTLKIIKEQINLTEPFKKRIWQEIVKQKIVNQAYVLMCIGKHDVEKRLTSLVSQVDSGDSKNIEGQAAKIYFESLFEKGFTRMYDNIFNACLDYGYTILRGAVARSIVEHGYIPCLGIHHRNELNNYNLADDFIEPFRPIVDLWTAQNIGINDEFNTDIRAFLVDLLNYDVIIAGRRQSVGNAIGILVSSFTTSIQMKDYKKILVPQVVPLERHSYE
ncbi:MAG: type II CRISPR-associated endonuclease Cas1 [Clostridia bacterium]|nr:type II CRISPR-associated endonuclease Cas1 [Clostridia bacterium]